MTDNPKPNIFNLPSVRAKKRLGLHNAHLKPRSSWKRACRKMSRKETANRKRLQHAKSSDKIRDLVAPTKVGQYKIVLLMQRYYEGNAGKEDARTIEVLKDIIPGRFKISRRKLIKYQYSHSLDIISSILRIYLKDESDLFAVQLAISTKIWRIKRVVGERTNNDNSLSKK